MNREMKVSLLGFDKDAARAVAYEAVSRYYPNSQIKPVLHQAFIPQVITREINVKKAKAFGWSPVVDIDAVIRDTEAEYIDICLPPPWRYDAIMKVIESEKHVFCENSSAISVDEARRITSAAEAKPKLLNSVNFIYRRCPANVYARRLVKENKFGKLLETRFYFNQSWGARLVKGPFFHWWSEASTLRDLGSHAFDTLFFVTGMRPIELVTIQKSFYEQRWLELQDWTSTYRLRSRTSLKTDRLRSRMSLKTDDATRVMYTLPDGAVGSLECTRDAWGTENSFGYELYFENGAIRWNYDDVDYLNIYDATEPERGWKRVLTNRKGFAYSSFSDGHMNGTCDFMVNALYENMLKIAGEPEIAPIATFRDAYEVERAIEAARVSWEERSWVKLEDFT